MSVCGNCPWPAEEGIDDCDGGCTFEDAAYRAQDAYDALYNRFVKLKEEYEKVMKERERCLDDGK
jgi:hypothetical protein